MENLDSNNSDGRIRIAGAQRAKARYSDAIFKAYDVRGKYPKEINEEIAYKIGRAVARFLIFETQDKSFRLRSQRINHLVIARDNRLSSEDLAKVLIEGIRDEGIDVIDIGLATTPMFYFSAIKWKADGGVMITASHNPKEYNGFKIIRNKAMSVGENTGLQEIKKLVKKNKFQTKPDRGRLEKREILQEYINHNLDFIHLGNIQPLKIVADTANGTAGLVVPELFKHIPLVKLIHIFSELDGNFPNHAPDPNPSHPETIQAIQQKVLSEKADLGMAFDGDGDRIIFVDENSRVINPDLIAAIIIHYYFKNAGKILYTVVASRIVKEEIENNHNNPICSKVGHTFIKEKMEKEKITFGAESSGHYYFKNKSVLESPLTALLMVIEIISKTGKTFSELIKPFQKYYLDRINFKTKRPQKIIKRIENKFKKSAKTSHLDGLTIESPDWWFNIRPSNTEPVIRLTIEAQTEDLLEEKKKEISKLVPFSS